MIIYVISTWITQKTTGTASPHCSMNSFVCLFSIDKFYSQSVNTLVYLFCIFEDKLLVIRIFFTVEEFYFGWTIVFLLW